MSYGRYLLRQVEIPIFAFVALHELIASHTSTACSRTSRIRHARSLPPPLCPLTRAPSSAARRARPNVKTPVQTSEQPRARNRAAPGQPMRTAPRARPCGSRQHLDVRQPHAAALSSDEHDHRSIAERPRLGSRRRVHWWDAVERRIDGPVADCRPDRMRGVPRLGRVRSAELAPTRIALSVHAPTDVRHHITAILLAMRRFIAAFRSCESACCLCAITSRMNDAIDSSRSLFVSISDLPYQVELFVGNSGHHQ